MEYNLAYALNYAFFGIWGISVIYALIKLRKMPFASNVTALWAAVILFIPFIGAASFLLMTGKRHA
ncbi:MAG TPA: PLDc N-terminal domain-containing protein [Anaerolineales bacterium]|nr:hypothetical protein [Anaerolineae bacterium]MBL1172579.1 hypothetical protein [Chloroflexota bacterium]MDL1926531.1 hypothetical protein [Anaerolineae bacterium AMX1]WKZ54173.1 MAG: PLDc N-terminal domain-containing protein [Anaerolineales bacterium]NOG76068.1 hypothetical protein [Chloroflexota bacterium]